VRVIKGCKAGCKRLTCEIDIELHHKAKVKAYQEGLTLTRKVVDLVSKWVGHEIFIPRGGDTV
jgi:hypothetical protein